MVTSPIQEKQNRTAPIPAKRDWCCGTPISGPHTPGCMNEPRDGDNIYANEAVAVEPPATDPQPGPAPAAPSVSEDRPYGFSKPTEFDFWTPSGDKVRLRKLRSLQVVRMKLHKAANNFTPELLRNINDDDPDVAADAEEQVLEAIADTDVFDRVLVEACVCPELKLGDPELKTIELDDKIAIWNAVMPVDYQRAALEAQQDALKSVDGPEGSVRDLPDGDAVPSEAE